METACGVQAEAVQKNLSRITNQIYKLLPSREEGLDWEKPLQTLTIELIGMNRLIPDQEELFSLLCKLEINFSAVGRKNLLNH